jgi:arsenite-transporting ATPase
MRTIFFLGKGGVGKSTLSILSGLWLAHQQKEAVVISLDRAHNLNDILGRAPVPDGLNVVEANLDEFVQAYLKETEKQLRRNYTYLTALNLENHFKVLRYAPGMEEFALLLAFQRYSASFSKKDYLIFDMPPTALALKFFGLPAVSLVWLEQLLHLREEILEKKEIISSVKLGRKVLETDKIKSNLQKQKERYERLLQLFRNAGQCKINIVSNDDSVSLAESERIFEFFRELSIEPHALIVNKRRDGFFEESISKTLQTIPRITLPAEQVPLVGEKALQQFLDKNSAEIRRMLLDNEK